MGNGARWGIIGDGQLARMLALGAYPLGIRPVVLTDNPDSPAGQVAPLQCQGSVRHSADLRKLLRQVDGAVIESEFVDCDALEATGLAAKVFPSIDAIRVLQDKLQQKKTLRALGIHSADFHEVPAGIGAGDFVEWFSAITDAGAKPVVLKFATLGYDGKGVLVLDGRGGLDISRATRFFERAEKLGVRLFAEDRVAYVRELAMIAVRGQNGIVHTWPLVISEQNHGICETVMGPAIDLGISRTIEDKAREACEKIGSHLGMIGVYAVEFFLQKDPACSEVLVNEIAPRVHNSGHYTQDAGCASQFENHWRAVAGLPLGSTTPVSGLFCMQNILGPAGWMNGESVLPPMVPVAMPGGKFAVHWYGKKNSTPGRKLGHLNGFITDFTRHDEMLFALREAYVTWRSSLTGMPTASQSGCLRTMEQIG